MIDYTAAMDTSSPIRPARKRTRGPDEDNSDLDADQDHSVAPGVAERPPSPSTAAIDPLLLLENQNLTIYARHCATKKKLRPEQITELDSFVGVSCFINIYLVDMERTDSTAIIQGHATASSNQALRRDAVNQ